MITQMMAKRQMQRILATIHTLELYHRKDCYATLQKALPTDWLQLLNCLLYTSDAADE